MNYFNIKLKVLGLLVIFSFLLTSIQADSPQLNATCLVPCEKIVDGGPGKDGIPAIDAPKFISVSEVNLADDELVLGVWSDGILKAYPYNILNWHEITNDQFNDKYKSITYCPLTGTGIVFSRGNVDKSTFGVSGKLFENNLIMYDRKSDSYWSQMLQESIVGNKIGTKLVAEIALETTWKTWKTMFPTTLVLSSDTGYQRDYSYYPYGNYRSSRDIFFGSSYDSAKSPDNKFNPKELTTVVKRSDSTFAIPFSTVSKGVVNFKDGSEQLNLFFDKAAHLSVVFTSQSQTFIKSKISNGSMGLPTFLDQKQNRYDFLGRVIENKTGVKDLIIVPSYNAFWFALVSFFPDSKIFNGQNFIQYSNSSRLSSTFTGNPQSASFDTLIPVGLLSLLILIVIVKRRNIFSFE